MSICPLSQAVKNSAVYEKHIAYSQIWHGVANSIVLNGFCQRQKAFLNSKPDSSPMVSYCVRFLDSLRSLGMTQKQRSLLPSILILTVHKVIIRIHYNGFLCR